MKLRSAPLDRQRPWSKLAKVMLTVARLPLAPLAFAVALVLWVGARDTTLNAVLVLMVVTSILGPVLTEIFAPKMRQEPQRPRPLRWVP